MAVIQIDAYQEIVDFMATPPTLEQMATFRFSTKVEARVNELLYAYRNRRLNDIEAAELDEFDKLEYVMRVIKLTAREKLEASQ